MIAPWPTERGGTGSAFFAGGEAWIIPVIHEFGTAGADVPILDSHLQARGVMGFAGVNVVC